MRQGIYTAGTNLFVYFFIHNLVIRNKFRKDQIMYNKAYLKR